MLRLETISIKACALPITLLLDRRVLRGQKRVEPQAPPTIGDIADAVWPLRHTRGAAHDPAQPTGPRRVARRRVRPGRLWRVHPGGPWPHRPARGGEDRPGQRHGPPGCPGGLWAGVGSSHGRWPGGHQVVASWSAMRRTPARSGVCDHGPGPSSGGGAGHDSSVIEIVSKSCASRKERRE